jgi:hypothetical protein
MNDLQQRLRQTTWCEVTDMPSEALHLISEAADTLAALTAENAALSAWECSECHARFADTQPAWELEGVTRCTGCVAIAALTARVDTTVEDAAHHELNLFAISQIAGSQWLDERLVADVRRCIEQAKTTRTAAQAQSTKDVELRRQAERERDEALAAQDFQRVRADKYVTAYERQGVELERATDARDAALAENRRLREALADIGQQCANVLAHSAIVEQRGTAKTIYERSVAALAGPGEEPK